MTEHIELNDDQNENHAFYRGVFTKIVKTVGITLGVLAATVAVLAAHQELSGGASAEAAGYETPEFIQEIEEQYEHEKVQNFECSTNGGFMAAKDAVEVSWDAPEGFGADTEYRIGYNVSDKDGNQVDRFVEESTADSFSYSFAELDDLGFAEGYSLFLKVNAIGPDGVMSPATASAHVVQWQHAQSDIRIEGCE